MSQPTKFQPQSPLPAPPFPGALPRPIPPRDHTPPLGLESCCPPRNTFWEDTSPVPSFDPALTTVVPAAPATSAVPAAPVAPAAPWVAEAAWAARTASTAQAAPWWATDLSNLQRDLHQLQGLLSRYREVTQAVHNRPWWRVGILLRRPWAVDPVPLDTARQQPTWAGGVAYVWSWLTVAHDCSDPSVACSCQGGFLFPWQEE